MLSYLSAPVTGTVAGILFLVNIILISLIIILLGIIKIMIPVKNIRNKIVDLQEAAVSLWIDFNNGILFLSTKTQWEVEGVGKLNPKNWYFIFANHQTWADILVMQKVFNRKIPLLKFFMKQELLWSLPMGGLACWFLDFPFMKRYSKAYLKKHPEMKNKDLETMQEATAKFKLRPTTVMNYLEGTRFTKQKQQERSSPYKHLLRPKSGGLAFVISELKSDIHEIINVTIVYCHENPTFWQFISGRVPKIIVKYEVMSIPPELYGNYYEDASFRKTFQSWVNQLWAEKDQLIDNIKQGC